MVAKSDTGDGNTVCTSFVLKSNELVFVVTAPQPALITDKANSAIPGYDTEAAYEFLKKHGLAVRSIGTVSGPALRFTLWFSQVIQLYAPLT